MAARELDCLLAVLDQAFDHKSWHGTSLRGSVRGLTHTQAAWRPAPQRHNIWEQVLHAAYWKYVVRRRLLGEPRGTFAHAGSDWFRRPDGHGAADWKSDVQLLRDTHGALRAAIAGLPPGDLHDTPAGGSVSPFALISGIAAHDLYHAGQIQLLKKLGAQRSRQ